MPATRGAVPNNIYGANKMKKVLLAEDHSIVVKGMKMMFETDIPDCRLDDVRTGADMMKALKNGGYQMAIIDLHLVDGDTLHLIADLTQLYPQLGILVFSGNPEELYAQKLYRLGVKGCLNKQSSDAEVLEAIRQVLAGKIFLSDRFKDIITNRQYGVAASNPFESLSHREMEVLNLLIEGKRTSEMSRELNLQPSTIATYKMKMFSKLGVANVPQLIKLVHNFRS